MLRTWGGARLRGDTTLFSAPGYDGYLAISGPTFVNGNGIPIQLRGASLSGYEDSAIQGVNAPDSSGGTNNFDQAYGPNLTVMASWAFNCVRIPLNEASWLGGTWFDATATGSGTTGWHTTALGNLNGTSAAGATYRTNIINQVAAANAVGKYAILDLHFTCPGRILPCGQDSMANLNNSIPFWQSVATTFKNNRAVAFELFNEPYPVSWSLLMNGGFASSQYINYSADGILGGFQYVYPYLVSATTGTFIAGEAFTSSSPSGVSGTIMAPAYTDTTTGFTGSGTTQIYLYNPNTQGLSGQGNIAIGTVIHGTTSGATATISNATYGFYVAGMAQMLSAIRGVGAPHACLLSGMEYNSDLSEWAANAPSDTTAPAGYVGTWTAQRAASWHPYANANLTGVTAASVVSGGTGYAVNDTITLPVPTTGIYANSVWGTACVLKVTAETGGVISSVSVNTAGVYSPVGPASSNPYASVGYQNSAVPQASTSGSGSGATFNLTIPVATVSFAQISNIATVLEILTSPGCPVGITEIGDYYSFAEAGLTGAPWFQTFAAVCDANSISLLPWSYNPPYAPHGTGSNNIYIIDSTDVPTPGFGAAVYAYTSIHAP